MALEDIRAERIGKLEKLKAAGMNPYPTTTRRTHDLAAFLEAHATLEEDKAAVVLAGRVMSVREHGGSVFADLYDGTRTDAKVQVYLKTDELGEGAFDLFLATVDAGDFVEMSGSAFTTKRGQPSLLAHDWRMLAKSVLPMPTEWFGLKDDEERLRKRYIDMVLSKDVAERARRRSRFWNAMRSFLLRRDFVEVETPILETTTGGAEARPFVTHHNALDMEVYLRISAGELWQKRLLVGGLPKTFEIGRIFRNEGMSPEHAQDYTQLEFYEAYKDYKEGMRMIQELYRAVAEEVYGTTAFDIRGHHVDLSDEWPIISFAEKVKERYGLDPVSEIYEKTGQPATEEDLRAIAREAGVSLEDGAVNIARTVDALWKTIRKDIGGPAFLIGIPDYMEPLAKHASDGKTVERFQCLIAGSEVGKGFSELNDPLDQAERFKFQQKLRDAGDEEAQMPDAEYVEAMEYGMPPAFGFGVSERLFAFFEGVPIREAQLFPLMRPRG